MILMYDDEKKSVKNVIDEKYEDRGWGKYDIFSNYSSKNEKDDIKSLPLSKEEYQKFSLLLSKLCIEDQNPYLCDLYFYLKERAKKGNHYPEFENLWEAEEVCLI